MRVVYDVDVWDSYVGLRDGVSMIISFDDLVANGKRPAELRHCARILIPYCVPDDSGGPISPESERLYAMEDELCRGLQKHKVPCRLVARLTYGGWRELVFQVQTWKTFRPHVGLWIIKHKDYAINVYEHPGWEFFDEYVRPTELDRLFIADRNVIDSLIESGSDPKRKHSLEFAFQGGAEGLRRVAKALLKRGYKSPGEPAFDSGTIEFVKRLPLNHSLVTGESVSNHKLAQKAGVDFVGWGAASVQ